MSLTQMQLLLLHNAPEQLHIIERLCRELRLSLQLEQLSSEPISESLISQNWDAILYLNTDTKHSGLSWLKKIKQAGADSLPIILLSPKESNEAELIALEAGASAYLILEDLTTPQFMRSLRFAIGTRKSLLHLEEANKNLQREVLAHSQKSLLATYIAEESTHRTQLFKEVATIANAPGSLEKILVEILEQICTYTGWPVGHVFFCHTPRGKKIERLQSSPIWYLADEILLADFKDQANLDYMPWEGLAGRVYTRQEAIWNDDLSLGQNAGYLFCNRHEAAKRFNFKSQLGFPIQTNEKVAAVIEFFSFTHEHPGQELLNLMAQVGKQISYAIERKQAMNQLQFSQERLQQAQSQAQLGAWEWNRSLNQLWISDEIYQMAEIPKETASNELKNIFMARIHPEDLPLYLTQIEEALSNKSLFSIDHRLLLPGDKTIHVHSECQIILDQFGQVQPLQGVMQNISARKSEELELQRLREEADAANLAKSTFLANMSHEIRTPLNAVLGCTQLLQQTTGLTEQQLNYLNTILLSGEHLLKLINEILEMSKIEAGFINLAPVPCHLPSLLAQVQAIFQQQVQNKPFLMLRFEHPDDLPTWVMADDGKLRQILLNLIGNSLKFTQNGYILLRVRYECSDKINACRLIFDIEDTGAGISAEELPNLFKNFVQTQSGKDSQSGTGLGLSLSQHYTQLLGGEITVQSELGKGSCFSFSIPVDVVHWVEEVKPPDLKELELELENDAAYRVLIVDDKEINRQILLEMLDVTAFSLCEAQNGLEAIEIFKNWQPHLILMDMFMPVMGGLEAIQAIRKLETGRKCVIISLTASAFEHERKEILAAGADDFMPKPFRLQDLRQKIKKALQNRFPAVKYSVNSPKLSEELRNSLKTAILAADQESILDLLPALTVQNSILAIEIKRLTDIFAYDQLINLLEDTDI
jgi:signal transduction histidine kinase/DNA-binding response OmpR family regulator